MNCTWLGHSTFLIANDAGERLVTDPVDEKSIPNLPRVTADAIRIEPVYVAPFIAVPVLVLMALWVLLMTSGKRKRKG